MSVCCAKMARSALEFTGLIDLEESHISENELHKRLEKEADLWIDKDRTALWNYLAPKLSFQIPAYVTKSLENFKKENQAPGIAVELGCGNSPLVPKLLENGWTVEAVDSSQEALKSLQQRVNQVVSSDKIERLSLICTEMETYTFPKDVQLIVAKDALPFCNPNKIIEIWNRAYDALKEGGRIVGNFFPYPCDLRVAWVGRNVMGSWYTDKAVVKALLHTRSYEIETCEYSKPRYRELFFEEPRQILFAAQKT